MLEEDLRRGDRRSHCGEAGQGPLEAAVGHIGDGPVDEVGDLADALGVGSGTLRPWSAPLWVHELVDHLAHTFSGPGDPRRGRPATEVIKRLGLLEGDVWGHGRLVGRGHGVDDHRPVGGEGLGESFFDLVRRWSP